MNSDVNQVYTARDAKRAYQRQWYLANRERVKAQKERYWQRQADKMNAAAAAEREAGR